jgi:hypothetical protein
MIDCDDEQGKMKCVKQPSNILKFQYEEGIRNPFVDVPYDCDLMVLISVQVLVHHTVRTKVLRNPRSFAPYRV